MREQTDIDFWEYMSFDELLNIVNGYPRFYINNNTKISDIEQLEEGNYIINEFPSVNLLKQFPYFMNNSGEIMILIIMGNIVMNVSKRGCSYYSGELIPILKDGNNILLNVHSHPCEDKNINVGVPSISDLKNCNSFNKLAYIIHDKGVLEFDLSSIENDIANSRKYYNGCVKAFNNKCQVFPSSIIAGMFHFEPRTMFEVSSEEERENVKVEF